MRRVLPVALIMLLLLTGCSKEVSNDVSDLSEINEPEEQVIYQLRPVTEVQEITVDDYTSDEDTSVQQSNINSTVGDTTSDMTTDVGVGGTDHVDLQYITSITHLPENYVLEFGFDFSDMYIIMGLAGDYECIGTNSCLLWESANGTFYKDSESIMRVDVSERSSAFDESGNVGDSVYIDTGFGIGTNGIDVGEIKKSMSSDDSVYTGICTYQGIDCYAVESTISAEDTIARSTFYISTVDGTIVGIVVNQEDMSLYIRIDDYYEYLSDLEDKASGTISDEEAAGDITSSMISSILMITMSGVGSGAFEIPE